MKGGDEMEDKNKYKNTLEDIGQKIRKRREKKGWYVRELADRTPYSKSYINYIENGDRAANIRVYIDIADAFNIKLETLFRS